MATRDRTTAFLELKAARGRNEDAQRLLHDAESRSNVSPQWIERMTEVRQLCQRIQCVIKELELKQKQHLKVDFRADRNEEKEKEEVEQLCDVIYGMLKCTEGMVESLDHAYKADLENEGTEVEHRILRNVNMCLVSEVTAVGKAYEEVQRRYMYDSRVIACPLGGNYAKMVKERLELDARMAGYLMKGMTQDQIEQIVLNTDMVNKRTKEIEKILSSIKNMHDMFRDLNAVIAEEGTVPDKEDYNMTVTVERKLKAEVELKKAAELQNTGTINLCIFFLAVLIVGLLIAFLDL